MEVGHYVATIAEMRSVLVIVPHKADVGLLSYDNVAVSHSFMQRPIYPSFEQVETVVDG